MDADLASGFPAHGHRAPGTERACTGLPRRCGAHATWYEGVEGGVHTHRFVENGLRAKQLPTGGTLTHDSGSITYEVSFDAAGNVTGVEVISVHGPHPAFGSDVWCGGGLRPLTACLRTPAHAAGLRGSAHGTISVGYRVLARVDLS